MGSHVWAALALAFCTWAVSLGALAAMQHNCDDSVAGSNCTKAYRYTWFVIALEFVAILVSVCYLSFGHFATGRVTVIGLFAIVTVLYIELTNTFLIQKENPAYSQGSAKNITLTMFAGTLMTATANFFVILAAGVHFVERETVEVAVKEAV